MSVSDCEEEECGSAASQPPIAVFFCGQVEKGSNQKKIRQGWMLESTPNMAAIGAFPQAAAPSLLTPAPQLSTPSARQAPPVRPLSASQPNPNQPPADGNVSVPRHLLLGGGVVLVLLLVLIEIRQRMMASRLRRFQLRLNALVESYEEHVRLFHHSLVASTSRRRR